MSQTEYEIVFNELQDIFIKHNLDEMSIFESIVLLMPKVLSEASFDVNEGIEILDNVKKIYVIRKNNKENEGKK